MNSVSVIPLIIPSSASEVISFSAQCPEISSNVTAGGLLGSPLGSGEPDGLGDGEMSGLGDGFALGK